MLSIVSNIFFLKVVPDGSPSDNAESNEIPLEEKPPQSFLPAIPPAPSGPVLPIAPAPVAALYPMEHRSPGQNPQPQYQPSQPAKIYPQQPQPQQPSFSHIPPG